MLTPRQKKITAEQDRILVALKKIKSFPFVLSGGTALSRFYFHHRFSEDLDFFCEEMDFSFEKVEKIAAFLRQEGFLCELLTQSAKPGHLKAAIYDIGEKIQIKVDFLEDPFTGMWDPETKKSDTGVVFRVDALDQIYYRKFFAIIEQWHKKRRITRAKDLVDLYFLHQYHRSIPKTAVFYRTHHVPANEEKIMMILAKIKKEDLENNPRLFLYEKNFDMMKIVKALNKAGEELFKTVVGLK